MKLTEEEYMLKAKKLNKEQRERVLSRMAGKLPKRLRKEKLTQEEAIAIQLEHEDAQLIEWKAKVAAIREKELKAEIKAKEKMAKVAAKTAAKMAAPVGTVSKKIIKPVRAGKKS